MVKKTWSVMDYDYTKTYPKVDYSELVTEPGLVLSMREIYMRYAAQGVDLLNGELVEDDDHDEEFVDFAPDDDLDVLAHASELKRNGSERQRAIMRSASKSKQPAKPADSPSDEGDEVPKRSEGDEKPESKGE